MVNVGCVGLSRHIRMACVRVTRVCARAWGLYYTFNPTSGRDYEPGFSYETGAKWECRVESTTLHGGRRRGPLSPTCPRRMVGRGLTGPSRHQD